MLLWCFNFMGEILTWLGLNILEPYALKATQHVAINWTGHGEQSSVEALNIIMTTYELWS